MSRRLSADQTKWEILKEGIMPTDLRLDRYAILIDERVKSTHSDWLKQLNHHYANCLAVIDIPSGERSKSVKEWNRITDALFDAGMRRNDTLLVVGGGVVGDLGGFVASTLFRGVRYLHIPTTLLAMVDSSIGGKVGINHPSGKNRIGAFYPPERIVVRLDFLRTLPKREWVNGAAEMLKYGYIREPELLDQLVTMPELLKLESLGQMQVPEVSESEWASILPQLADWIERSWNIKQTIVDQDEFEQGKRMFLNYGHTFGHALEQLAGYGEIDHGVAVLAGMVCAGLASHRGERSGDFASHRGEKSGDKSAFNISDHPIPLDPLRPFIPLTGLNWTQISSDAFFTQKLVNEMSSDKKNQSDQIRLILLESVGRPRIHETADRKMLENIWEESLDWLNRSSLTDSDKNSDQNASV